MRALLLLFIVVPIIEMWLLIVVGRQIGAIETIALVLLTAFIGISLLRYQGAAALLKARAKLQSGSVPAREMADGLFFAVGGALLLTPGFVTDMIGFACLTPGIRTVIITVFGKHLMGRLFSAGAQHSAYSSRQHYSYDASSGSTDGDVIEGEYEKNDTPSNNKTIDFDR